MRLENAFNDTLQVKQHALSLVSLIWHLAETDA